MPELDKGAGLVSLDKFRLGAAQIFVPVSMAKIKGQQKPGAVAEVFVDDFMDYVTGPKVDAHIITSEGLYANDESLTAFKWRGMLDTSMRYRRKFSQLIDQAASENSMVIPYAYQLHGWDQMMFSVSDFGVMRGRLRQAYNTDPSFKDAVHADLARQGRQPTPDKIAFILEEHALTYALMTEQASLERRLTSPNSLDQQIFAYPGPLMDSQIKAYEVLHGRTQIPDGQWLYADVSDKPMRLYDIGRIMRRNSACTPV
ncbi:MAG: hypothetical protein WDO70_06170 [Alphaproteobacteria bacterium]